ncbi:UNVERIFIED_CONTAM: hypothetical protein GTU68_019037 [Idotea baltica]|nr:hypothetical protein [Idotea baltica]
MIAPAKSGPQTLFEKIWDQHVVYQEPNQHSLLYIDLHLVHEVTSPQAFEGLRIAGRQLRRPELTVATQDHNVPTTDRSLPIVDPISKQQIQTLRKNCSDFGVRLYDLDSINQGIVHVIGPELGFTQPGMTIVCGDSHTATHGAFGALAFGIGTSEVEHVMATQIEIYDSADIAPQVTWGTNPGQVTRIDSGVPSPSDFEDPTERKSCELALEYMDLKAGTPLEDVTIDRVFIGSCTNSRIQDLRAAAAVVKGKKVDSRVQAMVVPGSGVIKKQAEEEGLDKIFVDAGFEWREAGCSMCLAMNPDKLEPGERCASTSNRNFEGRQGRGGRTHLVSPAMAAAAAVKGHFVDIRGWDYAADAVQTGASS